MGHDSPAELNPRTNHYEFLGPPGALLISLGVPIMTYLLYFGCSEQSGGCPPPLDSIPVRVKSFFDDATWWKALWDSEAMLIYLAWYAFCVLAWLILPGEAVEGTKLRTGGTIKYKCNGELVKPHSLTANPDGV